MFVLYYTRKLLVLMVSYIYQHNEKSCIVGRSFSPVSQHTASHFEWARLAHCRFAVQILARPRDQRDFGSTWRVTVAKARPSRVLPISVVSFASRLFLFSSISDKYGVRPSRHVHSVQPHLISTTSSISSITP